MVVYGRTVRRELLGADTDWYERSGSGRCTIRPDLAEPEVEAEVEPVDNNEETLDGVRPARAADPDPDAEETDADDGVAGRE